MEELTQNVIRQDGGLYNIGTVKRLITVESYGDTFVIPDGVQVIGECAFWKCDKLKRVVIPDSVKDIGVGAFMGCEALKEVVIPNSVTRIERDTFSYCLSLEKVTLPASLTLMKSSAFYGCNSLKEIIYHNQINKVDEILPGVERACLNLCLGFSDPGYIMPLVIDVVLRKWNDVYYNGLFNLHADLKIMKRNDNLYY